VAIKKRPLVFPGASEAACRLRDALKKSSRAQEPLTGCDALPVCDAARRFWSERAWSEFAAVPATAQMTLAAVRDSGPLEEIDALSMIATDEVRHTELAKALAEGFGGYISEIPEEHPQDPVNVAQPYDAQLAFWIVGGGCISETVSLELLRACANHTRHPVVMEVLSRILKDEAMHARVAWLIAERLFPSLSEHRRNDVGAWADVMLERAHRAFTGDGLPEDIRKAGWRDRAEVAEKGLGVCPPQDGAGIFKKVASEIVIPRLVELGLPIQFRP
jgi:hypothetical protein